MPISRTPVSSLGGIYKRYSKSLEKIGINNLEDFLFYYPFRYDNYSIISKIAEIQEGETLTLRGKIIEIKNQYTRKFLTIQRAKLKDDTGEIELVWFNQPYIVRNIKLNDSVSVSGKIERKGTKFQITSPDYEISDDEFIHTGRIVPIYKTTRGISTKWIRKQTWNLIKKNIDDYLPEELIKNNSLISLNSAIKNIHFPENDDQISESLARISFDELFLIQLASNARKQEWKKTLESNKFIIDKFNKEIDKLIKNLPFSLTSAQNRAIKEIFSDFQSDKPMNRLLEGDVGSGKTVVAAISMFVSYLNGFQSVIMAPTEILAQQHFKTISKILEPHGVNIGFATSSKKENIEKFDILIGTHAVIQKKINYKNLGLIIIDEQQRFGVEQRALLRSKGKNPHLLTMTATPIPRTIALTMYGDLDLSVLDELPKGRKEIKTWLVPSLKRKDAYDWIKKQIDQNKSQVFIVCPFIEESETMQGIKAAKKEYEDLKNKYFNKYKIELLHGKLKSKEKDQILSDFKEQKFDILVATPVVEVGIDIPNADIIIIEAAERFGLSQLHQLRGRVGRNDRQAYCLLFTSEADKESNARLIAMTKTNIGSELAELDLKIRGAGDLYGSRQSGRNFLKVANFSDINLIKKTKKEADKFSNNLNEYPELKNKIEEINIKLVSPD